jgi:hypothetical protein
MSRSNPQNENPNPATRWFEWKSTEKCFSFYDKATEQNILIKLPFTFILLDRTATVRGYSKKQQSGIHSNEVKDTRSENLVVKFFKGPAIAQGLWADIKDTVTARGGKFAVNAYIAYKEGKDAPLKIGAIQMVGCAVGAWFDFEKAHRKDIYEKAIRVASSELDESGDVSFNRPVFTLADVTAETNAEAVALDKAVQEYFAGYFKRPKVQQTESNERGNAHAPQPQGKPEPGEPLEGDGPPTDDTDVPF